MTALPVDAFVGEVRRAVRERRAVVVTAAPGAGKTTRIPPALTADGPVLLLQPRRVAARAIARRIAEERQWIVGREVGWQVRFERRFTRETRLLVATEGVLTARLQHDPLLSDFLTVVIDEFHERSIHADLGLALARQAWLARLDLRIVLMSATLDAERAAGFLGGCPIVAVPGRLYPVDVTYQPGVDVDTAVSEHVGRPHGAILCFLPGAPEIRRAHDRLAALVGGVEILPLHGGLTADEQDRAIAPSERPRVILATNLAETTLTVPGVRLVIDSGWHKVARYDAARGVDSLETERISRDAADQRSGRAGRTEAGAAIRLWDARDRLRPHREPEIARIDLASVVMDVIAWGGDPRTFEWFDAPPPDAIDLALGLLRSLGALDSAARLTPLGRELRRFPLHPRLARLMLAANGAPAAARACAILSERHFLPALGQTTACDLLAAVDHPRALPGHVTAVAREIREVAESVLGSGAARSIEDREFRRAVLAAYPDRVARRRVAGHERFLLASGSGARLGRESGVFDAEFIVAVDIATRAAGPGAAADDAVVRIATAIDREWIAPTSSEVEHDLDRGSGTVGAVRVNRYGAIALNRQSMPVDAEIAATLIAQAYLERGFSEDDRRLFNRLASAGTPWSAGDVAALVREASLGVRGLDDVDLLAHLPTETRRALERDAPADLLLPSGRRVRLEYRDAGRVVAAAKLQELFGLAETPRLGPRGVPVTFELLAPNGRPVQVTTDLKSFWRTVYPEVRKELRRRYPRHPWPDDPWTATPTSRPLRRR